MSYADYLASPEWREKREAVRLRALGRCEFCGAAMAHVHHVRYPKRLGTEPLSDLIAVCKTCHDKSHGVRSMELEIVPDARPMEVAPPTGVRIVVCASINGNAYATVDAWAEALKVAPRRMVGFRNMIELLLSTNKVPGSLPQAKYNGTRVVSWQVIAEALRGVDRKYHGIEGGYPKQYGMTADEWRDMVEFVKRIDALMRWGWDMQSQAIAGRMTNAQAAPAAVPDSLWKLMEQLGSHTLDHKGRIERIESITIRRADEPVTVQEALFELALDSATIVRGRLNLGQCAGMDLAKSGAQPAGKKMRRLDGCSVDAEVRLWRRGDAYRAIGALVQRDFSGLLVE